MRQVVHGPDHDRSRDCESRMQVSAFGPGLLRTLSSRDRRHDYWPEPDIAPYSSHLITPTPAPASAALFVLDACPSTRLPSPQVCDTRPGQLCALSYQQQTTLPLRHLLRRLPQGPSPARRCHPWPANAAVSRKQRCAYWSLPYHLNLRPERRPSATASNQSAGAAARSRSIATMTSASPTEAAKQP